MLRESEKDRIQRLRHFPVPKYSILHSKYRAGINRQKSHSPDEQYQVQQKIWLRLT